MSECLTRSVDGRGDRAHYGLAVYCAKRFFGRGVPPEDLIGEAEAALLWAAARYDETRGVRFSTYAIPVVLGALRETCRRSAPMHIPRDELRVLCAAEPARDDLRMRCGREPTMDELGRSVGVQPEKLALMLSAKERMTIRTQLKATPPDMADGFEDAVLLRDAVRRLGRPYAQVLWLRYFGGMSQEDIARRFGISQPQVSRWERTGKERLRAIL